MSGSEQFAVNSEQSKAGKENEYFIANFVSPNFPRITRLAKGDGLNRGYLSPHTRLSSRRDVRAHKPIETMCCFNPKQHCRRPGTVEHARVPAIPRHCTRLNL